MVTEPDGKGMGDIRWRDVSRSVGPMRFAEAQEYAAAWVKPWFVHDGFIYDTATGLNTGVRETDLQREVIQE